MGAGERGNRILEHQGYREYLKKNEAVEKDRIFCRHDLGHFLDVARIAMILNAGEGQGIDPEMIYGAALLHDIGRHLQYLDGTPHEEASAFLAGKILEDCGYTAEERDRIVEAIGLHRCREAESMEGLNGLLYRADKLSRSCYACQAESQCSWKKEKKNLQLIW